MKSLYKPIRELRDQAVKRGILIRTIDIDRNYYKQLKDEIFIQQRYLGESN